MTETTLSILKPVTSGNLTIFLIAGPEAWPDANLLTLEEALAESSLIIHETGNVSKLAVENLSACDVFLQAGDLVKGGLQDRVIGVDLIVPAGSEKIPLKTFCVESGRWRNRVSRSAGAESSDRFNSANHRVASREIKFAALHGRSQSMVWEKVHDFQESLGDSFKRSLRSEESPTSLQLTLEDEQLGQNVDEYLADLLPVVDNNAETLLGYAFAINGRLNSADIYTNSQLFRKLWPRLLRASVIEALGNLVHEAATNLVGIDEVRACLNQPRHLKWSKRFVSPRITLRSVETEKAFIQDTCDADRGGAWFHRNYLVK
jgi:hypothetical protein